MKKLNLILISGMIICSILIIDNISKSFLDYQYKLENSAGTYNPLTQKIEIKAKNKDIPYIQEIFYHELGHHIWFKIMNETEREQYAFSINKTDKEEIQEDFAQKYDLDLYKRREVRKWN